MSKALPETVIKANAEKAVEQFINALQSCKSNDLEKFVKLYQAGVTFQVGTDNGQPLNLNVDAEKVLKNQGEVKIELELVYTEAMDALRSNLKALKTLANDDSLNRTSGFCLLQKPAEGVVAIRNILNKTRIDSFVSDAKLLEIHKQTSQVLMNQFPLKEPGIKAEDKFYLQAHHKMLHAFGDVKTTMQFVN